jgi:hypothetical protein
MNGSYTLQEHFGLFGAGIGSAIAIFYLELVVFVWDTIRNALPTIPANSTATNEVLTYYSGIINLFIVVAIIQNAVVGFLAPKSFIVGYLLIVGGITYFLYTTVLNVVPTLVYGMAGSFAVTIGSLAIRLYLESQRPRDWGYYP